MCFGGNKYKITEYIENIDVKIILEVAKARVKRKYEVLSIYIIIKRKLLNSYPTLPKNFKKEEQNKISNAKLKKC